MLIYDSIKTYNEVFNHPTLHPLISMVDLSKGNPLRRSKFRVDFYAIIIKDSKCGDLRYGLKYYDYEGAFLPGRRLLPARRTCKGENLFVVFPK